MIGKVRYVIACSMILVCVGIVNASPTIMWEDFEDENGNGAFDPAFTHVIGFHSEYSDSQYQYFEWGFSDGKRPSMALDLVRAFDYITFELGEGQFIGHASVMIAGYVSVVKFIGEDSVLSFMGFSYPWPTVEADISEIGALQAIHIYTWYGYVDDIILTVVPEPSTWALFICGVVMVVISRRVLFGRKKNIV